MLLGLSGKASGNRISMELVKRAGSDDGGVRHGARLARLCEAMAGKDPVELAAAMSSLKAAMSPEQIVDAVG